MGIRLNKCLYIKKNKKEVIVMAGYKCELSEAEKEQARNWRVRKCGSPRFEELQKVFTKHILQYIYHSICFKSNQAINHENCTLLSS
jgi:spore maturation protein CgeB